MLGPADDGGYYLLGMKQPHPHLFADIAWSTGGVAAATRARAAALGLDVVTLPTWYDVDDAASLDRLVAGADRRLRRAGHQRMDRTQRIARTHEPRRAMTDPVRRLTMLAAIGVLLVLLVAGGLALLDWQPIGLADETRLAAFVASLCVAGALWLLAVAIVRRGRLPPRTIWLVLGVAVAMRLLTLTAPPVLSSDLYRYVWDGRVQLAGINPYRYLPAADELAFLRDEAVYPHINRAEYAHTVYPPAAQVIFALAAAVTPGVFGMKLMIAAFDALAIVALIAAAAHRRTRSGGTADLCLAAAAGLGVRRQCAYRWRGCRPAGPGAAGCGARAFGSGPASCWPRRH